MLKTKINQVNLKIELVLLSDSTIRQHPILRAEGSSEEWCNWEDYIARDLAKEEKGLFQGRSPSLIRRAGVLSCR